MTTENVDTGSPAGGAAAAADTGSPNGQQQQQQAQGGSNNNGGGQQPPAFTVPDTYKDRSWAGKLKSPDDVWKQLDNLDQLAGKKTVGTIDYETATPEQIAAHHAKLAPADTSAYQFGEGADPEFSSAVAGVFKENGINAYQGNQIIKKVLEIAGGVGEKTKANATSAKAFLEMAKARFGDEHEKASVAINNTITKNATPDDLKVFNDMDNATRIAVDQTIYNLSKGYEERIAKILKEHGIKETGAQGSGGDGQMKNDAAQQRAEIRKQMRELAAKPHTQAEKDALQQQLNALIGK